MHIAIHIHIHRHTHIHTHYIHIYHTTHIYINHTYTYTHVCMHVCMCTHIYIICLYHLGKYIQSLLSHHPFGSCFFPKTTTIAPPTTHVHLSICPDTPPLSKWLHLCPLSVTAGWHLSLPWSTENSGSGTHNTWGWHIERQAHPPCSPGPQLPCSGEAQTKARGEATCRCPGWQPSWGPS